MAREAALRYTPDEGTVREHDAGLELRALDEGRGVPEDQRRAIFDKYTRAAARSS